MNKLWYTYPIGHKEFLSIKRSVESESKTTYHLSARTYAQTLMKNVLRPSSNVARLPCRRKLQSGLTVARHENNSDLDDVTESNQNQDLLRFRNNPPPTSSPPKYIIIIYEFCLARQKQATFESLQCQSTVV